MKKSLIALAVLGSVAGVAQAQSSVTLYGIADVWLGSTKETNQTAGVRTSNRVTALDSSGFSTSRFGFKGSEDLGGGLKANFQLEQGINSDTGTAQATGSAFNRQSWVGLSGGFGEVQLGRAWTPYDDTRAMANDTFNANIAASFNTWLGYTDRTSNGIRYNTPSFGGFSVAAAYALGEDKTTGTSASSITSVSLNYANGPIVAGLAHQIEKDNNPAAGGIFVDQTGLAALAGVNTSKRTYTLLNGSYDLGVAKLVGGLNTVKGTSELAPGFEAKANEFNLGVDVPLSSALALGFGFAQSKIEVNGTDVAKTRGFTALAKYNLSKRTFTYAALANTKTKYTGSSDYDKGTLYAVGLQHSF